MKTRQELISAHGGRDFNAVAVCSDGVERAAAYVARYNIIFCVRPAYAEIVGYKEVAA